MRGMTVGLVLLAFGNLILTGVAAAFFLLSGLFTQRPVGWEAAYVFGTPVTVELPSSCEIETIIVQGSRGPSVGECEGATWTVDGQTRTGTLFSFAADIEREGYQLVFTGEARALDNRVYGRPDRQGIVFALTELTAAGIGLLTLVGCGLTALLPERRLGRRTSRGRRARRLWRDSDIEELHKLGLTLPETPRPVALWVCIAEIAFIVMAAGVYSFLVVRGSL